MARSAEETNFGVTLGAFVELMKPVTWFPPMWAFMCGVVSAGVSFEGHWSFLALGALLTGPLVCATSQIVNDWFDRGVDAVNEPYRPIPSGRVPGDWGFYFAVLWSAVSLAVASLLGSIVFVATIIGLILAWAYSAPPPRLKMNGWWGNAAVAICYEGLPWVTGASVMAGALPNWPGLVVPLLYSFGAHGIMTLNDFKSIEGDKRFGIASLPVQYGVDRAVLIACVMMAIPQFVVIGLLFAWHHPLYATIIAASLGVQLYLMTRLAKAPRERAPWYNATGVSLYVSGMMVAALALRAINGGML